MFDAILTKDNLLSVTVGTKIARRSHGNLWQTYKSKNTQHSKNV